MQISRSSLRAKITFFLLLTSLKSRNVLLLVLSYFQIRLRGMKITTTFIGIFLNALHISGSLFPIFIQPPDILRITVEFKNIFDK